MPLLLILLSLAGLIAGSILFWKAWRTRHGTLIHCANCNANVNMAGVRYCHNCNRELNESTVAIGKLQPDWSMMMLGGMGAILSIGMVLLALFWMSVKLQSSWYSIYDNQEVLADLAKEDGMHLAAARALVQRMFADELTRQEYRELKTIVKDSLQKPEADMLPRIDPRHVLAAELIWHGRFKPEETEAYLSDLIIVRRNQGGRTDESASRIVVGPKVVPGLPKRFRLSPFYVIEIVSFDGAMANVQGPEVLFLTNGCYTLRMDEMHAFDIDASHSIVLRVTATWYDLSNLDPKLIAVTRGDVDAIEQDDERFEPIRQSLVEMRANSYASIEYLVSMDVEDGWTPVFQSGKGSIIDVGVPITDGAPADIESAEQAPPNFIDY